MGGSPVGQKGHWVSTPVDAEWLSDCARSGQRLPSGDFVLPDRLWLPAADRVHLHGAGTDRTRIIFTGSGPAVSTPGTLCRYTTIENLTIYTATAAATALLLDNAWRPRMRNVLLQAPNGVALHLLGSPSKSTYLGDFRCVDMSAGVACIDIAESNVGHQFHGGILEGAGLAIRANGAGANSDTCRWFGTNIHSSQGMSIGGGSSATQQYGFLGCRFEADGATLTFGASSALCKIIGGSKANSVNVTNNGTGNEFPAGWVT